jgi:outer membrane lipoprotein SlyB
MALTPIAQPVRQTRKAKKGGLGGIVEGLGAVAGGISGGLGGFAAGGPVGAAAGATAGAIAGRSGGAALEQSINPGQQAQAQQQAGVPLTALQESGRGQQILTGLQVARNDPELSEYAAPLTQAYIQNRINLHKMG